MWKHLETWLRLLDRRVRDVARERRIRFYADRSLAAGLRGHRRLAIHYASLMAAEAGARSPAQRHRLKVRNEALAAQAMTKNPVRRATLLAEALRRG